MSCGRRTALITVGVVLPYKYTHTTTLTCSPSSSHARRPRQSPKYLPAFACVDCRSRRRYRVTCAAGSAGRRLINPRAPYVLRAQHHGSEMHASARCAIRRRSAGVYSNTGHCAGGRAHRLRTSCTRYWRDDETQVCVGLGGEPAGRWRLGCKQENIRLYIRINVALQSPT